MLGNREKVTMERCSLNSQSATGELHIAPLVSRALADCPLNFRNVIACESTYLKFQAPI